jgi:hypothetical protein
VTTATRPIREERLISSLGEETIVTFVWKRGGEVQREARGFRRIEWRKMRHGPRVLERRVVQLFEIDGRSTILLHPDDYPQVFVQSGPSPGPPPKTPPDLELPPDPLPRDLDVMERRACRAFEVDRALPDRERAMLAVRAYGIITRPGPGDYPPEQITRDLPTRAEVTDYMVVMGFVRHLDKTDQRYIRLRSFGLSFRSIADRMDTSEGTIRATRRRILARLCRLEYADGAGRAVAAE